MIYIRRVVGYSMYPTLRPGNIIVAVKWPRLKEGDIVIASTHGLHVVKRIFNKQNNMYNLIGDNEGDSLDSKKWGLLPKKEIKGKVVYKYKLKE